MLILFPRISLRHSLEMKKVIKHGSFLFGPPGRIWIEATTNSESLASKKKLKDKQYSWHISQNPRFPAKTGFLLDSGSHDSKLFFLQLSPSLQIQYCALSGLCALSRLTTLCGLSAISGLYASSRPSGFLASNNCM